MKEYVSQLLKGKKTEIEFYEMFDKCIEHAKGLNTPHQEPKKEWYDDAAKFFE